MCLLNAKEMYDRNSSMSKMSPRCVQMHRKSGEISTTSTVKSVGLEAALWILPFLVHIDEGGHSLVAFVASTQLPV